MATEDTKTIEQKNKEYNNGRNVAMFVAGSVYIGVVLAVTVLFVSFVLSAFPEKAYASRLIMTVAGLLVGGSMISFPIAIHLWTVEKWHRTTTIILYFLELVIIAVNTIVAFAHLLAKNAGLASPEWVVLYEPFSIGAIVYTLFAWGTVFLMDPSHKRKAKELQNEEKLAQAVANKEAEFLESIEGEDVIQEIAEQNIREKYHKGRFVTGRRHWGSGKQIEDNAAPLLPDNTQTRQVVIPEEIYKRMLEGQDKSYPVENNNHKNPTNPPR